MMINRLEWLEETNLVFGLSQMMRLNLLRAKNSIGRGRMKIRNGLKMNSNFILDQMKRARLVKK